ncbi:MAG: Ig-like domain-containing protein [Porphyromonadaceae bacterium]|uniref:GHF95 protein n=2 Tax=environmental samples TaxID=48479 RepID=G9IS20_9BACT|nr:GHF95 protein [uncultured bacterium A2_10]AEW47945.1 GHF95 protein [uncultured bacterium B2_18]MCE5204480.1 Ig-like domain-containing protein [Porphyromonadaceae bacterium]
MQTTKRIFILLFFVLCILFSCEKEDPVIKVTAVTVSEDRMTITEGDINKLHVTINPEKATNKKVTWKSSNASVVFVDQHGEMVANKAGNATITVTTEEGNKTATCDVTVELKTIPVTGISLNKPSLTMVEGDSEILTASIEPSNSTNKSIVWGSSNNEIASVDYTGKVSAHEMGTATLTATSEDGNYSATCDLTVEENAIPVASISLNKIELMLVEGDSEKLTATIVPSDATYKDTGWISSDESIVTVDTHGNVTAVKPGVALISVTAQHNGKKDVCAVVVEPNIVSVTGVTVNKTSLTIDENESETLTATIEPSNATNRNVSWISGDNNIATVDSKGKVFGVNVGNTTITVTTEDGRKTAVCDVAVTKSWLSLSRESFHTSGAGESFYIDVTASDDWSVSSKPPWITITPSGGTGQPTGVSSVKVTVSSYNGSAVYRSGDIIFTLNGKRRTATFTVDQYNFPYVDGDYVKVQSSTRGDGIDLVFLGDGYTIDDIGRGRFTGNLNEAIEHFFSIEPYKSYRNYFDVYIVYAFSEESGISDHLTTKNTSFSSTYENPNTTRMTTNNAKCFEYALKVPLSSDLTETLITVITNSTRYAGTNWSYSNGMAISIAPVSNYSYPYDFRGVVQHEAAGHGFGQLADEYTNSNAAIPAADKEELRLWQQWGFYGNVDLTNDLNKILWKHFIGEPNYSYVGAHEGGYYYAYGVWRPEVTSLMINNIPYINAPGRELIVRRIKKLAGETFSFDEFKQKDVRETHALTRSTSVSFDPKMFLPPPILIKVN